MLNSSLLLAAFLAPIGGMSDLKEIKREECEQRARSCIDLARQSTDANARETLIALAEQWAELAKEMARLSSRQG
jgi:hypothetical protein